ncbi:MAG: hypothetical protein ACR2JJ_09790 [Sphingomicrobium sp.]
MPKNLQTPDAPQKAANQKNMMSDNDPGDGNRTSFTLGKDGSSPAEKKPNQDRQDQETIEEFGERGVATSDKEA